VEEGKCCHTQDEDQEHDGQLEVGIQSNGKDLGCWQQQGQDQHNAVPKPKLRPAEHTAGIQR